MAEAGQYIDRRTPGQLAPVPCLRLHLVAEPGPDYEGGLLEPLGILN